jgi:hypothetical protein
MELDAATAQGAYPVSSHRTTVSIADGAAGLAMEVEEKMRQDERHDCRYQERLQISRVESKKFERRKPRNKCYT